MFCNVKNVRTRLIVFEGGCVPLNQIRYTVHSLITSFCQGFAATAAKSLQSCPTLCDPVNGSPPGSSVPGILQARILEWVVISFSNACMPAPTLCNPMDSSPLGSSVHRILQARILERVAISFSHQGFRRSLLPWWLRQ